MFTLLRPIRAKQLTRVDRDQSVECPSRVTDGFVASGKLKISELTIWRRERSRVIGNVS